MTLLSGVSVHPIREATLTSVGTHFSHSLRIRQCLASTVYQQLTLLSSDCIFTFLFPFFMFNFLWIVSECTYSVVTCFWPLVSTFVVDCFFTLMELILFLNFLLLVSLNIFLFFYFLGIFVSSDFNPCLCCRLFHFFSCLSFLWLLINIFLFFLVSIFWKFLVLVICMFLFLFFLID